MTPDEHYREAERYLGKWEDSKAGEVLSLVAAAVPKMSVSDGLRVQAIAMEVDAQLLASAQVHATLATLGKRAES